MQCNKMSYTYVEYHHTNYQKFTLIPVNCIA